MEQAAEDQLGEKDALMRDHRLGPGICKVAVAAKTGSLQVFFTSYHESVNSLEEYPKVWEVAQATTADEDFDWVEIKFGRTAGWFHNCNDHDPNPVFGLCNQAIQELGEDGNIARNLRCLISIGTGGDTYFQTSANSKHTAHSHRVRQHLERARTIERHFTQLIGRDHPRYYQLDHVSGGVKADLFGEIKSISGMKAQYLQDSSVQKKVTAAAGLLRDADDASRNSATRMAAVDRDSDGTSMLR